MEKFCLKWNDFQSSVTNSFRNVRNEKDFCDVTLVSDDEVSIKAHKFVLSSSSTFFKTILLNNPHQHPLLYLSGINSTDLNFVLDYIYQGEVQLFQEQLDSFLNVAQMLKIEGLLSNEKEDKADTIDQKTYPPEAEDLGLKTNLDNRRQTNKAFKRDHEQEESSQNVGVLTAIDSTDANEIKAKVRELIEKIDGKYSCKVCHKSSSDASNMQRHIETHIDGLSYNCQYCGKTFRTKNSLSGHVTRFHSTNQM